MRRIPIVVLGLALFISAALGNPSRFVIDDDEYLDSITSACQKLLREGKLKSLSTLRSQLHTKGSPVKLSAIAREKLAPAELCERLRESTLAIGTFYKCPDCSAWHFNSSAGFVVAENGVVSTCCHVVQAEDQHVKEGYLVAADSNGHVFPVESVLAADTEADTCFLKIDAHNLKPLSFRTNARAGDRVFCLSHPGGYHFMFTEGMVARVNRRRDDALDEHGRSNGLLTRPILFLNITAEFAPGSSGAPIVDEAGNVLGQVASIADAGDIGIPDANNPPSPSVPVRFCTATEEILRLTDPNLEQNASAAKAKLKSKVSLEPETVGHRPRNASAG
jgi:serine protease Do